MKSWIDIQGGWAAIRPVDQILEIIITIRVEQNVQESGCKGAQMGGGETDADQMKENEKNEPL